MADRYATIITRDDGKEVISDIRLLEGEPTEPRKGDSKIEKAELGWQIGMVRGGEVKSAGGFGFENDLAAAGRSERGYTRASDDSKGKPQSEAPVEQRPSRAAKARKDKEPAA